MSIWLDIADTTQATKEEAITYGLQVFGDRLHHVEQHDLFDDNLNHYSVWKAYGIAETQYPF